MWEVRIRIGGGPIAKGDPSSEAVSTTTASL